MATAPREDQVVSIPKPLQDSASVGSGWVPLGHFGPRQRYLILYLGMITLGAAGLALAYRRQTSAIAGMWVVALVAGWLVARLSSRALRRSLRRLREAAEAIGRGELDHRIDLRGHDDFVKLADALDLMASRLEAHMAERESLQKELAKAEKLASLGELAATVAHEVNNPLDGLQNAVRIIRRAQCPDEQTAHLLDLMEAGLARIEKHVQKLMGLARCEPPQIEPVRAGEVIEDALLFVQPRLNRRGIRVVREGPPEPTLVLADRMQLAQVVINLLLNAADAMPLGGEISIVMHGRDAGGHAALEVRDTGAGISAEHLPHIWEPFFSTKKAGEGTGLGLSVVARIVEAHHGRVTVESQVGRGTMFRVELPAARESNRSTPEPEKQLVGARTAAPL